MKKMLAAALFGAALVAPQAHAGAVDPFPYCEADRLFVVYEASESFLLHGAAKRNDSVETSIRCYIRRFGTTIVASAGRTAPGPASAVANVVGTPYGGMEVCMTASYRTLSGLVTNVGPSCHRIAAP